MIDKHDPELLGLAIRECKSKYGCSITAAADTVFDWLSQGWRLDSRDSLPLGGLPPTPDLWPGEAREIAADAGYNPTMIPGWPDQTGTGE